MDRESEIQCASQSLLSGGVVLLPTDTVNGIAAVPECRTAVDKIYALKKRLLSKPLPLMIPGVDYIHELGIVENQVIHDLVASPLVPGALTIIASVNKSRVPVWLSDRDEVAFRIPANRFLCDLMMVTGSLYVTSANMSGESTPRDICHAANSLSGIIDYVVREEYETSSFKESTIVNCKHIPVTFERIGSIPQNEVTIYLNEDVSEI